MGKDNKRWGIVVYLPPEDRSALDKLANLARAMPAFDFVAVGDMVFAPPSSGKTLENTTFLQLPSRLGKGACLRAGINHLTSPIVGFVDVRAGISSDEITAAFQRVADEDIDGVVGSRFSLGSRSSGASTVRRASSILYRSFARLLFGLSSADPQGPLKVFRRQALDKLFEHLRLYNHGFDVELLFQACRAKLRIEDLPLSTVHEDRNWPIIPVATSAVFALLILRALYSPFARLPLVRLLGYKYSIPAKCSYSILMFCWRDPKHSLAGGGEIYLYEQAKAWIRHGHRVTWFAQRERGSSSLEMIDGIKVVRRGTFPWCFLFGGLWYVFFSKKNYDFIIDCMNGVPFFTPLFSTKPKVCLVYHIHSHHFKAELPPVLASAAVFVETKLVPLVYRRTPFITISESTRTEMLDLAMSPLPIGVIKSGVGSDMKPGTKAKQPTVLYLGRLKRYKRVRLLVDAFAKIKQRVPNAQLIIAGSGDDEEELRKYARDSGAANISFVGKVTNADKLRLMQQAWVFGMPSEIEGWGIVVIEANACGTPALVYDVPGLRDCVRDGETGLIAHSDKEYAQALELLLKDPLKLDFLSKNALAWSEAFSWERTAEETLAIIRALQPWQAVFERASNSSWSLVETASLRRNPWPPAAYVSIVAAAPKDSKDTL